MDACDRSACLRDAVSEILRLPFDERSDLVGQFVRDFGPELGVLVNRLARSHRVGRDEAASVVMATALDLFLTSTPGHVDDFMAYLSLAARREMTRQVDLALSGGLTGIRARVRRARTLNSARLVFLERMGHPPESDAELIAFHNALARERRSSPSRQGALAGPSDLHPLVIAELSTAESQRAQDAPLTPQEGRELVEQTITRCREIDPVLGDVARAFLGGHLEHPGEIDGRVVHITRATRLQVSQVPEMIGRVRNVAAQVAREMLGA